ncbi:phosphodiesterase YaeI [Cerasicoccus maritimus]|uniref:phosphodiesterase YaeI n=1 Tax=Cerasicoccus maritimus TaxID=490089 RepID=UPI00285282FF|nr:phosphodiesterase YaeI [Cerasicoccus maritimus]
MRLTRKAFLATLLGAPFAGLAGLSYMHYLEPHWLEVTQRRVPLGKLRQPIRLLHLSDLHASDVVSLDYIERAIDLALEQNAQLACLTGDFITWSLDDPTRYAAILRKLSAAMPTYACIGNHDGGKWAGGTLGYSHFGRVQQMLTDAGVDFLFNEKRDIAIDGQTLTIAGLGDLWSGDAKPETVLAPAESAATATPPVIVLSHNPDTKTLLQPYQWDLTLCGHTHGGQLIIPFFGVRPFLPVKDKHFAEGLHHWDGRHLHITRGIGNLHGLRFNCRPEVSVLTLG